MASFTDSVPQFNPYIQQNPVEAMATVGVQREQQFQEGIQKVQSLYDNLLGLPIAKQETQDYVKMKVNELNNSVKQSVSGDFSDQRLVNQIAGLAGKISSDPIIQNGVRSTNAIQGIQAAIEQSKKDKTYAPQNEDYYNTLISQWMHDGDLQTSFNASYTPYVDYEGEFIKAFKDAHPGEALNAKDIYEQDDNGGFKRDAQGKLIFNPTIREGVDANRIANIWNLVASKPEVQKQLEIDGWSRYKGVSASSLWNQQKAATNSFITNTTAAINDLNMKIATDKTANVAEATAQINAYKEQIKAQKDRFEQTSQLIQKNPAAAKAALVDQSTLNSLVGAYAYQNIKKSPLFETNLDSLKWDMEVAKFGLEQDKFKYQRENDAANRQERLQIAMLAHLKGKKTDENGNPIDEGDVSSTTGNVPQTAGTDVGIQSFQQKVNDSFDRTNQAMYGTVFDIWNSMPKQESGNFNPLVKDQATGQYKFNVDATGVSGYKTMDEAHNAYLKAYSDFRGNVASGNGNATAIDAFKRLDPVLRDHRQLTQQNEELDKERVAIMNQVAAKTGVTNPAYINAYIADNKLPGWQSAEARLKLQYGPEWRHGLGIESTGQTTQIGGSGLGVGNQNLGTNLNSTNLNAYEGFSKKFDKSVVPRFAELEEKYKAKQQQFYPIQSTFLPSKDAEKEPIRQQFIGIANSITGGEGALNNAYGDFKKLLSDDKEKFKNNIYGAVYDKSSGKYYLTVQRDTSSQPEKIEVSQAQFESFPQLRSSNDFENKFGSTLSLSGGVTTDLVYKGASGGAATAFIMDRPYDSKYDVRYHVVQKGNGLYDLKLYIKDNKTGQDIVGGTMGGFSASRAGIMDAIQKLSANDLLVEGLIPPQTLAKLKNAGQ